MDDMMRILSKLPNGTYIKIEWDSAMLALGGIIETIYQTDNGMPETVSGFQEYYAAAFRIKDVLKNESGRVYTGNMVMEISAVIAPSRIWSQRDILLWQAENNI